MLTNKQKQQAIRYTKAGISQPLIAKRLEIPYRTYSRWIRDDKDIKIARSYYLSWLETFISK